MADEIAYGRRLVEWSRSKPDATELIMVDPDGVETGISWRELEVRSNQIASLLEEKGVTQDALVALALPSCADHIYATLATWRLGATLLPLRYDMPQWEMSRLLDLACPAVLVSDRHTASCPVLSREDFVSAQEIPPREHEERISETAYVLASSGSTGLPKLIVRPVRGSISGDSMIATVVGGGAQTILINSPLYHINGFSFAVPPLLEGARVVIQMKFDARRSVELIEKHQVTFTVMVPTMLQRVARLESVNNEQLRSLRRLIYGGAPIADWVVERWCDLIPPERFIFTYGSSEGIGLASMTGTEWKTHRGATGVPINADVKILNERGSEVAPGEVGEIYMRPKEGLPRFRYIGMPMPTPTAEGFMTIGDMGYVDKEGFLYVVDRRTDMIITGGANVFPAEVEAALSEHPDIADQVVIGLPDDEWGRRVHAIVQTRDIQRCPSVDDVRRHCKERLAGYKVPKTYEFVELLPRTEAGKINRSKLVAERAGVDAR